MGLASQPQPRRTKSKQRSSGKAHTNQPGSSQKASQHPAKKKRGKTTKNLAPWTVAEDVVIRSNYPRYGSDVTRWTKRLTGRKKGDIEKRAKWLGLVYRPRN